MLVLRRLLVTVCVLLLGTSIASGQSDGSGKKDSVGRELSSDELEEYKKDFIDFDLNADGHIDAQEIRIAFKNDIHPRELYQFFFDVDQDDSGTVTMEEYIDYAITVEG
ncbi:unnamed protein product [Vitrella brassicaformis CCMP3155]|uniref:EF-hand domain-containing protein n=1 Tax=Vitrella brassicaformis (strain CCMP3155) TaxID=1169540 RepID=A0A0G4FTY5_VITBC|nr:unnamed protein product [Vitrella brassicaformis CCMP3155]|eukprot:CEM17939.1 unnamed protein product [Vitrella brassicaformis CCMP3155]